MLQQKLLDLQHNRVIINLYWINHFCNCQETLSIIYFPIKIGPNLLKRSDVQIWDNGFHCMFCHLVECDDEGPPGTDTHFLKHTQLKS